MVKRESDPRGNLRKITRKSVVSGVRFTPSARSDEVAIIMEADYYEPLVGEEYEARA